MLLPVHKKLLISFKEIDTWLALCLQLKESNKAVINQMLKAIWDCLFFHFTSSRDWSEKLLSPSQPIRCKTETNRGLVTRVFPRSRQFVLSLSSHRFLGVFLFALCGHSAYFGFTILINNALWDNLW